MNDCATVGTREEEKCTGMSTTSNPDQGSRIRNIEIRILLFHSSFQGANNEVFLFGFLAFYFPWMHYIS
jgi:hypothetical protein